MANRLDLHGELIKITKNVYYQPPTNTSIQYPAIIYSIKNIENLRANDKVYSKRKSYTVTIVDRNPDSILTSKLEDFKYCKFDRSFVSDGLNHFVYVIYY